MIVWFAHVKVGHRQTPLYQNTPAKTGVFAFQDPPEFAVPMAIQKLYPTPSLTTV